MSYLNLRFTLTEPEIADVITLRQQYRHLVNKELSEEDATRLLHYGQAKGWVGGPDWAKEHELARTFYLRGVVQAAIDEGMLPG